MKSPNSFFLSGLFQSIGLNEQTILQMARDAGFTVRKPRKIGPAAMLNAVCFEASQGTCSLNDVASRIDSDGGGDTPSKQAVGKRMNEACLVFFQDILARAIQHKTTSLEALLDPQFFKNYNRVIVQDSTIVKLPQWLFEEFSGVSNAHTAVCNARIQAVYDIKNMRFIAFSIDPYSKNDLLAAPELEILSGDLVLRDRGYLISGEIERHIQAGAHCIYRHKTGSSYLDVQSGKPIDLPAQLNAHGSLDISVRLNNLERTLVRLLAVPVPEEVANKRRMKAKKETKGHAPSQAVLALMSWTIFITTIPCEDAEFEKIQAIYGLRWRIEIIFKAWKSHMKFNTIHRVSKTQLLINLSARLLVITACFNALYRYCLVRLKKNHDRELSLLKFLNYLMKKPQQIQLICSSLSGGKSTALEIWKTLKKYCCYDRRRRKNYNEICNAMT